MRALARTFASPTSELGSRERVGPHVWLLSIVLLEGWLLICELAQEEEQRREGSADGRMAMGLWESSHTSVAPCSCREGIEEKDLQEQGIYIRSGIIVVLKNATLPDGFEI